MMASTPSGIALPSIEQIVEAGQQLCASSIPVQPLLPGLKRPVPKPRARPDDAAVYIVDNPDEVEPLFRSLATQYGTLNLSFMVGRPKNSSLIAVGLDIYKPNGPKAEDWARTVGMSSSDPIWIMRTGRGGITGIFYHPEGLDLRRSIEANGSGGVEGGLDR